MVSKLALIVSAVAVVLSLITGRLIGRIVTAAPQVDNGTTAVQPPAVSPALPDSIVLTDGVKSWRASTAKLGADRGKASFDSEKARAYLARLAPLVAYPGRSASLVVGKDGSITITRSLMARALDVEATVQKLQKFARQPSPDTTFYLVLRKTKPAVTTEDLQGINARISSYTTRFSLRDRNRTHNLRLVAEKLNGAVIPPGGVFSFNERVGPRDHDAGYRKARIYANGRITEGIGGGTCQVSGTLYNAALLAGLTPVARSHHSMTVAYLPPGRDATVNYGTIDLKLRNDTGAPVYVRAGTTRSRLTVSIYGARRPGHSIRLRSSARWVKSRLHVKVYRIFLQDGRPVRKELVSTDVYKPKRQAQTPSRTARRTHPASRPAITQRSPASTSKQP
ncbi:MAG: VanW family protein [Armatimonadota bacterium]